MNLKRYLNKTVEVCTMAPTTFNSWVEGEAEKKVTVRESNYDGTIEGVVDYVNQDSIIVRYNYRGKTFRYDINAAQIIYILASEANASGLAASERMKAQHAESKK